MSAFQGLVDVHPPSCGPDPMPTLSKLWLHESMRVFHDRLTTEEDQKLIKTTIHGLLSTRFGCRDSYASIFEGELPVLFADFTKVGVSTHERVYEQVAGVYHMRGAFPHSLGKWHLYK
jgi:dynein heavy chain, axonemal